MIVQLAVFTGIVLVVGFVLGTLWEATQSIKRGGDRYDRS
jgi:hypothetical protein